MSGVHALRSGFVTKSAVPSVTRIRGVTTVTNSFNINAIGTPGAVYDVRVPQDEGPSALVLTDAASDNSQTAVGSASPYRPDGYWSCDFSGSNSYLQVVDSIGYLNFTGNFTLEAWVYLTANPGMNGAEVISKFINGGNGWYALTVTQARTVTMRIWDATNVVQTATSTATVPLNTWVHISGGRNGSDITVSVAGTYTTSPLTITPRSSNSPVAIGVNAGLSVNPVTGMISNVRAASYALYSANFTPNTTPVLVDALARLLMCNGPYFFNRGTNGLSVTAGAGVSLSQANPFSATDTTVPGSGSFSYDGSLDHHRVTNNAVLDLTTGNWTCEGWFFATAFKATETIIFAKDYQNATTNAQYGITVNATKNLVARIGTGTNTTSTQSLMSTSVLQVNCWYHFAFVKNGTTLTLFLNGKQEAAATQTATMTHGVNDLIVGSKNNLVNGTVDFAGQIGDLRIVKSALYTSDFLPSLEKMTAVANTVLLLVGKATPLDASPYRHQLRVVAATPMNVGPFGRTSAGSIVCFANTVSSVSSLYAARDLFNIGTQDFTIDLWAFITVGSNAGADGMLFNLGNVLYVQLTSAGNGGKLAWRYNSTYRTTPVLRSDLVNKWTHIAVARQSGVIRFFVDGVLTNTGGGVNPATFPDAFWGDSASYAPTTLSMGQGVGGLLSHPRLIIGQALYTSTFAKPTEPPTAVANTRFLMTVPALGIADATYMGNARSLTAIGTPTGNAVLTNTTAPSGLTESFDFNGSRYIAFSKPGDNRLGFSTGNFTAECFVRVTATGSEKAFFGTNPPGATYPGWFFGITSTGALTLTRNTSTDAVSSALTWDANTWYHVAAVRYGNTVRFYRDGTLVSVANITAGIGFENSGGYGVMIGARHSGATVVSYLTGYIAAVSAVASPKYLDATHTVPSLPLLPMDVGPNFITNAVYGVNQLA